MKFDRSKEKDVVARDVESYQKFLAGDKTLYAQAFWENGRRLPDESPELASARVDASSGGLARN